MPELPPTDVYLGKIDGQWPVHMLLTDTAAMHWLTAAAPGEWRRVWPAKIDLGTEVTLVEPAPYLAPVSPREQSPSLADLGIAPPADPPPDPPSTVD